MSFTVVFTTAPDRECGNAMFFQTRDDAEAYGRDFARRWAAVESWRVEEVSAPPRFIYRDGGAWPIEHDPEAA